MTFNKGDIIILPKQTIWPFKEGDVCVVVDPAPASGSSLSAYKIDEIPSKAYHVGVSEAELRLATREEIAAKLIPSAWYEFSSSNSYYIARFKEARTDIFIGGPWKVKSKDAKWYSGTGGFKNVVKRIPVPDNLPEEYKEKPAEKVEEEKWAVGGYVRIIKNGSYRGSKYHVGEIWKVTEKQWGQVHAERNGISVILTTVAHPSDVECEWVGMEYTAEPLLPSDSFFKPTLDTKSEVPDQIDGAWPNGSYVKVKDTGEIRRIADGYEYSGGGYWQRLVPVVKYVSGKLWKEYSPVPTMSLSDQLERIPPPGVSLVNNSALQAADAARERIEVRHAWSYEYPLSSEDVVLGTYASKSQEGLQTPVSIRKNKRSNRIKPVKQF